MSSATRARAASGSEPTTCTRSTATRRNRCVPSSTLAPGVASDSATTPLIGARTTKRVSRPTSPSPVRVVSSCARWASAAATRASAVRSATCVSCARRRGRAPAATSRSARARSARISSSTLRASATASSSSGRSSPCPLRGMISASASPRATSDPIGRGARSSASRPTTGAVTSAQPPVRGSISAAITRLSAMRRRLAGAVAKSSVHCCSLRKGIAPSSSTSPAPAGAAPAGSTVTSPSSWRSVRPGASSATSSR